MVTDRFMMGKNGVYTFFGCFSLLFILACNDDMHESSTSSNFGLIGPPTVELAALKRLKNPNKLIMGKICLYFFSAVLDWILFILAGNNNIHESLDEFEIQLDPTTGFQGNRYGFDEKNGVLAFSRLYFI